jgi:triosephosphate isomerase (TIM)
MRKQIVAGNWKMNTDLKSATELVKEVIDRLGRTKAEVVLAVPYVYLQAVSKLIKTKKNVFLAAQNMHHEDQGAFTGEISAKMLRSLDVSHVLIGHSERREYNHENTELLVKKVNKALEHYLTPIFCCGEPLAVRESGKHVGHVNKQLKQGLFHLPADKLNKVVIAYEPVWAIGTGKTATSQQAQDMHESIRKLIARSYGPSVAEDMSILYGGSCNPANASELFKKADVDGGLIGGASLKANDFLAIIDQIS